jgi:hypothetical protein
MKSEYLNAPTLVSIPPGHWSRSRWQVRESSPLVRGTTLRHAISRLLTGLVLASVLWSTGTMMAWKFLHLRGYGSVSYKLVALPWLWPEAARAQGEDLIFNGRLLALNEGSDEAVDLIAQGVSQAKSQDGCLLLAQLLATRHDEAAAVSWLVQGLNWGTPSRGYVQALVDLAQAQDDVAMTTTVLQELWRSGWGEANAGDRQWLANSYGCMLEERREWGKFLAWSDALPSAIKTHPILLHGRIKALLASGQKDAVFDQLRGPSPLVLHATSEILPLLAEAYILQGNLEHATRVLQLGLTLANREPLPHLRLLEATHLRPELMIWRQRILEAYMQRYSTEEEPLARLARQLGSRRAVLDLSRLHSHARAAGFAEGPFLFPLVDALLENGQVETVQQLLPGVARQNWSPTELSRLNALQHLLAEFLPADPLLPVTSRLEGIPADADLKEILGLATVLSQSGRPYVARELLTLAQSRFPHSYRLRGALHRLAAGQPILLAPRDTEPART